MPVAIVIWDSDVIPAVLMEKTDSDLLASLRAMKHSPDISDVNAARAWLSTLPAPSGWYTDTAAAMAETARMRNDDRMTGEPVAVARNALGLSRAELAERIGYNGNSNTRHKTMFEVEKGDKSLSPQATRALRGLLAEHGIAELSN